MGYLFVGTRCGNVWMWCDKQQTIILDHLFCHQHDVSTVDIIYPLYVTGSKDTMVKIWNTCNSNRPTQISSTVHLTERIWCCRLRKDAEKLIVGTSGIATAPISVIDVNR